MITEDEMFDVLEEDFLKKYIEDVSVISTGYNTVFIIHAIDSSVLEYLNNNEFPVVYSDTDGFILVKF